MGMSKLEAPIADSVTTLGMVAIVVAVAFAAAITFGQGVRRRIVTWLLAYGGVMLFTAALAVSGVLAAPHALPPPMAIMLVVVILGSVRIGRSSAVDAAAHEADVMSLVRLQAFRLPLELLMHHAWTKGIMPKELSFSGYNYDIVTGISAALLAIVSWKRSIPRLVIWAWNIWGMLCLGCIAVIAIVSSPMVRGFGAAPEHVNTWVLYFPYVWLPTVLVPTAIVGHIVVTRRLLREGRAVPIR